MNLSYLSFYSQYIYSPITNIHKINSTHKVLSIFFILSIIPYLNTLVSIYFIIIFLIYKKFIHKISVREQKYLYLLILIYFMLIYKNFNFTILNRNLYKYYCIPYKIKKIIFEKNIDELNNIKISLIYYMIPIFIIKTYIIYLIYLEMITLLFITTKYENIISCFLNFIHRKQQFFSKNQHILIMIISFISQFLERIIYNLNNLYLSITLKYNYSYKLYIITYKVLHRYILNTLYDTYTISTNLWNREILIKNFYNSM